MTLAMGNHPRLGKDSLIGQIGNRDIIEQILYNTKPKIDGNNITAKHQQAIEKAIKEKSPYSVGHTR